MNAHFGTHKAKLRDLTFLLVLPVLLLFAACTSETPTPVPLATANVPSIFDINGAIARWESGNNQNYFISIEETTHDGTFLYRIVFADGEVRAAQRSERIDGEWGPPAALDLETAEGYSVDALLARILRDATGNGPAPLNMFVNFDNLSGFPTLVEARAIPSYGDGNTLLLNREHSYTMSVSVGVLLEETFGLDKDLVLTLYSSGGPQAWCSALRIFSDGSSIYTDDCRQIMLQLTPPKDTFEQLQELASQLTLTEDSQKGDSEQRRFILNGTGDSTASAEMIDAIWALAVDLNELLSKPIGTGVTMLWMDGDRLAGFDMQTNMGQPATLEHDPPLHGGLVDPEGRLLIFSDASGLKWLDTANGDSGTYASHSPDDRTIPVAMTADGRIVLQRLNGSGDAAAWGWIAKDDRAWHDLPETGSCITGVSAGPSGSHLAVATRTDAGCGTEAPLWIVDLESGSADPLLNGRGSAAGVAWSPDGSQLAVILEEDSNEAGAPSSQLYLINPDGSGLTSLTENATGRVNGAVWSQDGSRLFFGIEGADTMEDALVEWDLTAGAVARTLPGARLEPLQFDPSGQFLAFAEGGALRVWLVEFGQIVPVTQGSEGGSRFLGWLSAGGGE